MEIKGNEIRTLNATIDSLKSVNEELKVRRTRGPRCSGMFVELMIH